jgi:hypothetical protein
MEAKNNELSTYQEIIIPKEYNDSCRLWNPNKFIVISIIFSFFPAAILYSLNYGRLGFRRKRNILIVLSFVLFCFLAYSSYFLKQDISKSLCYCFNVGLGIYMRNDQKRLYKKHIDNGGKKASYLLPMIFTLVFMGILIFLMIYAANIPQNSKSFNGNDLYYTENVNMNDVDKLGKYLVDNQLFSSNRQVSVKLDKLSDTYIFSIIIDKKAINDKNVNLYLKALGNALLNDVFINDKVEIEICDTKFNALKTIYYTDLIE